MIASTAWLNGVAVPLPTPRRGELPLQLVPFDFSRLDFIPTRAAMAVQTSRSSPPWTKKFFVWFVPRAKSGGERAALQTLRATRRRPVVAPALGVRWLQHRLPWR